MKSAERTEKGMESTKVLEAGMGAEVPSTKYRSWIEDQIAEKLEEEGIEYDYMPFTFLLTVGEKHITFRPDFRLKKGGQDIKIDGRTVVTEHHGEIGPGGNQFTDNFFEKMNAFMHSSHAEKIYLLFSTDIDRDKLAKLLRNRGYTEADLADEIWFFRNDEGYHGFMMINSRGGTKEPHLKNFFGKKVMNYMFKHLLRRSQTTNNERASQ